MGDVEPHQMRISDADRHRVQEILRQAAGEGRLDLEELDERLEASFKAKTYGELVPLTADILGPSQDLTPAMRAQPPTLPGRESGRAFTIMGGIDRKGVWAVPREFSAFALMGSIHLDLRQAQFPGQEVILSLNVIMGGADVVVNRSTHVIVDGLGIMGAFEAPRGDATLQLDAGSPVVRVKGVALMGGVTVRRRAMPGENPLPGWRRRH